MSNKLRVFVSSTMKDLANERDAVCRKLSDFNVEPVNAEGWLPGGNNSWDRIAEELKSSNVFVLLLGESYGWIPMTGPKSGLSQSVTETEYREARARDIPILPFVKNLAYGSDSASDQALRRDAFRTEVMAWDEGYSVATFDLASDLAEKVGQAVIEVLTREYLRKQVQKRLPESAAATVLVESKRTFYVRPPWIPEAAIRDVLSHEAILFAGAGMSLAAGLPSAAVFAQCLAHSIREVDPHYTQASSFAAVAADFESLVSRSALLENVKSLLNPPQGASQTSAHDIAVQLFDMILTTNWDNLFEQALSSHHDGRQVLSGEIDNDYQTPALVKLHGSLKSVPSLLLTELDISQMDRLRPKLWNATVTLLRDSPIVVVGSSLRDPSIIRLFEEAQPQRAGYFVSPFIDAAAKARLQKWNLAAVSASAESFFDVLKSNVGHRSAG